MLGWSLSVGAETPAPYRVGDIVQDFTLPDLDGKPVKLSDFRGKPIVLAFFATW
jgi:peroxiredoxin